MEQEKPPTCDPVPPESKKMKPSDFDEYDSLVGKLADMLNIAVHPDTSVTIKAARLLIERIVSSGDMYGISERQTSLSSKELHAPKAGDEIRIQQSKFSLDDVLLPTATTTNKTSEPKLNVEKDDLGETYDRAARSLKLLYLNDQKELQLKVNEIISSIQSITANPKTDYRLIAIGGGGSSCSKSNSSRLLSRGL